MTTTCSIPRMMLRSWPHEEEQEGEVSLYLHDLFTEQKQQQKLSVPQLAVQDYAGSSQGFILTVDRDNRNLHATNPLTGTNLDRTFPSTLSLPFLAGTIQDEESGELTDYVLKPFRAFNMIKYGTKRMSKKMINSEESVVSQIKPSFYRDNNSGKTILLTPMEEPLYYCPGIQIIPAEHFHTFFYKNVILSPSLDVVAAVFNDCSGTRSLYLGFAHISSSSSSSSSWNAISMDELKRPVGGTIILLTREKTGTPLW